MEINIDTNVVAITGPTDTGKSSILRALRWAALNKPSGIGHMRDGCDTVDVGVRLEDDTQVKRSRSKKNNSYLTKHGGEVSRFDAIGSDVPESVAQVFNVGSENFQGQHDPPFWFTMSAGEVAKELNKIVDLSTIDEVAASLASKIRKKKAEVGVWKEQVAVDEQEVKKLQYVDEMVDGCSTLEMLSDKALVLCKEVDELNDVCRVAANAQEMVSKKTEIINDAKSVLKSGVMFFDAIAVHGLLEAIIERGAKLSICAGREIPDMTELIECQKLSRKLQRLKDGLSTMIDKIIDTKADLLFDGGKLMLAETDLQSQLDGMCPICGGAYNG